jgi:hypothetical protein
MPSFIKEYPQIFTRYQPEMEASDGNYKAWLLNYLRVVRARHCALLRPPRPMSLS